MSKSASPEIFRTSHAMSPGDISDPSGHFTRPLVTSTLPLYTQSAGCASLINFPINVASVASPTTTDSNPTTANTRSAALWRAMIFFSSGNLVALLIGLAISLAQVKPRDVEQQRHHEQHQPHRENRPVRNRPVLQVAPRHLNDERRDRHRLLFGVERQRRLLPGRDGDHHRLPQRPRDPQDVRRRHTRERR